MPSRDRAYPDMQRWTTHSPNRQETSVTPERGSAVLADPREGRQRDHLKLKKNVSITTNPARLTALQVACSVRALPGPCTPSKHAACGPAMPHLRARAAADPAPLRGGLAEGGGGAHGAGSDAVAVADRDTDTVGWAIRGRGSEIARAHGRADIRDVAREGAIIWEVAVRRRIRNEMR